MLFNFMQSNQIYFYKIIYTS